MLPKLSYDNLPIIHNFEWQFFQCYSYHNINKYQQSDSSVLQYKNLTYQFVKREEVLSPQGEGLASLEVYKL